MLASGSLFIYAGTRTVRRLFVRYLQDMFASGSAVAEDLRWNEDLDQSHCQISSHYPLSELRKDPEIVVKSVPYGYERIGLGDMMGFTSEYRREIGGIFRSAITVQARSYVEDRCEEALDLCLLFVADKTFRDELISTYHFTPDLTTLKFIGATPAPHPGATEKQIWTGSFSLSGIMEWSELQTEEEAETIASEFVESEYED